MSVTDSTVLNKNLSALLSLFKNSFLSRSQSSITPADGLKVTAQPATAVLTEAQKPAAVYESTDKEALTKALELEKAKALKAEQTKAPEIALAAMPVKQAVVVSVAVALPASAPVNQAPVVKAPVADAPVLTSDLVEAPPQKAGLSTFNLSQLTRLDKSFGNKDGVLSRDEVEKVLERVQNNSKLGEEAKTKQVGDLKQLLENFDSLSSATRDFQTTQLQGSLERLNAQTEKVKANSRLSDAARTKQLASLEKSYSKVKEQLGQVGTLEGINLQAASQLARAGQSTSDLGRLTQGLRGLDKSFGNKDGVLSRDELKKAFEAVENNAKLTDVAKAKQLGALKNVLEDFDRLSKETSELKANQLKNSLANLEEQRAKVESSKTLGNEARTKQLEGLKLTQANLEEQFKVASSAQGIELSGLNRQKAVGVISFDSKTSLSQADVDAYRQQVAAKNSVNASPL